MIRRISSLRPSLRRPLLACPSTPSNPKPLSHLAPQTPPPPPSPATPFSPAAFLVRRRSMASSPNPSSMSVIDSKEQYATAINKAQDQKLPAIFYFTAVWCGPCRLIAPKVEEFNKKFPHVTTYKIDIDQEGLKSILNDLRISAVPTFHFFQNGKKEAEVIGADVARIKQIFENLYKLK